jgi:RNA polymerase sigma factor (sigma-70 family)
VNRAVLKSFLRSIADPATPDADVLARYRDGRDPAAFAELVTRYGRLVWSVCKHRSRTEADAEDAFQATFLIFSQRASSVRKGTALGAWLYGVASRVCSKDRRTAGRRAKRERANGVREATNDVAASAWDRALAAVHEEVETLPDSLRVPFVLCALEGRSPSDAAASLGWKLGTFSGRLTRAKDALIAKLDARGLTAGAVAAATVGVNVADAPAAVVAKAIAYASRETVVPQTILHLSQGVIEMNVTRVKVLAAAVLVACGLASGVGSQWVATAQDPFNPLAVVLGDQDPTEERKKKFLDRLDSVYKTAKDKDAAPAPKSKWEYQFLTRPVGYAPSIEKFQSTIKSVENDGGWEYVGLVNTKEGPDRETLPTLVFRRPVRVEATAEQKVERVYGSVSDLAQARQFLDYKTRYGDAVRTVDDREKRIAMLESELAALKSQAAVQKYESRLTLAQKDLPLGVSELQDVLGRVASKIGVKNLSVNVTADNGGTLHLAGPKESIEWAKRLIQTLSGTTDPVKR